MNLSLIKHPLQRRSLEKWVAENQPNVSVLPQGATGRSEDGHPKYHRLTPTGQLKTGHHPKAECKCDCGRLVWVQIPNLRSENSKSCGCLKLETISLAKKTHGATVGGHSKEYRIWHGMLRRCLDKSNPAYHRYGGRGVLVCEKWRKFEGFYADMGKCPDARSLDRIDNNGNYEPSNCRWATNREQSINTRRNVFIEFNGERMCLSDWCNRLDMCGAALKYRLSKFPIGIALTKPKRIRKWHSKLNHPVIGISS